LNRIPCDVFAVDDYAYIISNDGYLSVANVSDVDNPQLMGSVGGMSQLREIVVEGKHAYACGDNFIYVIDITEPANPTIEEDFYAPAARGVFVLGEYMYVPSYYNGMYVLARSGAWGIDDEKSKFAPESITLYPAYPNPFNPTTMIRYNLPQRGLTTLAIYDLQGREVLELMNAMQESGVHSVALTADRLPAGLYIVRLLSGNHAAAGKLAVVK
jgi:hypothetical protein